MIAKLKLKNLFLNIVLFSTLLYIVFNYTEYGKYIFESYTNYSLAVAIITGVILAISFQFTSTIKKDE